jgi:hypothetical protein
MGACSFFVEDTVRADVVCLTGMALYVPRDQWQKEQAADDDDAASRRI